MSSDFVKLGDHAFAREVPLSEFAACLAEPSSTHVPGPPPPAGHENNKVHLFDVHGIYLIEHHQTQLIQSVSFVLNKEESPFPVQGEFSGRLLVLGQVLSKDTRESELAAETWDGWLAGRYRHAGRGITVNVDARGHRLPSRRRSKIRRVVSVSVRLR